MTDLANSGPAWGSGFQPAFEPARPAAGSGDNFLRSPFGRAVLRQLILLSVVMVLAAPAVTPAAGLVRYSFPGLAALLAGWLALRRRTADYLTLCVWLFLLTPFVRRMVDLHAGFVQANVLMLAPYLAAAWGVADLPRFLFTPGGRAQWPIAVLLLTVLYGFLMAVGQGRAMPATVDLMRWVVPPIMGCYIIVRTGRDPDAWAALCLELRALALVSLPLMSLYGFYQLITAPLWDVMWMRNNSGMTSIGLPYPFQIRVFSTMNSPASMAYWLNALILLTLTLRSPLRWVNVGLGLGALAISLVRSAWLGLVIGFALLLARSPVRVRASVMVMLAAMITLSPLALSNPRIEKIVSDRVQSLTRIGGDKSYSERKAVYEQSVRELTEKPWGEGLGIANVAANYSNQQRVIDGGPVEITLSLGVIGGLIYIAVVGLLLIVAIIRPIPSENGDAVSAFMTIAIIQALSFSSVTTTAGEIGVLFWISVAVVISAPRPSSRPRLFSDGQ